MSDAGTKLKREPRKLLAASDEELIRESDRRIAARYGVSTATVKLERRYRKIQPLFRRPHLAPREPPATSPEIRPSHLPIISWKYVPDDHFVGKTNYDLAAELGCSPSTVRAERLKRGLPQVPAERRRLRGPEPTDEELTSLSTSELAARYARSTSWVICLRLARGLDGLQPGGCEALY